MIKSPEHTTERCGQKDPAMIVGLGPAVMNLEIEAAEPECEIAIEQRIRHELRAPEIVVFPARLRTLGAAAELAGVDRRVVAAGALVSRETVEHRLLGNDARLRLSRLQESLEPECVVDVPMGEDRSMDRRGRLLPQRCGKRGRERRQSGIHQHDAVVGLERGHAAEPRLEPGPLRHLDRTARPEEFRLLGTLAAHRAEMIGSPHVVPPTKVADSLAMRILPRQVHGVPASS
jgi:hypothetical protein